MVSSLMGLCRQRIGESETLRMRIERNGKMACLQMAVIEEHKAAAAAAAGKHRIKEKIVAATKVTEMVMVWMGVMKAMTSVW